MRRLTVLSHGIRGRDRVAGWRRRDFRHSHCSGTRQSQESRPRKRSDMCTTIAIGKMATVDGSVIIAHSDDDVSDERLIYVPAADHGDGSVRPVYYDDASLGHEMRFSQRAGRSTTRASRTATTRRRIQRRGRRTTRASCIDTSGVTAALDTNSGRRLKTRPSASRDSTRAIRLDTSPRSRIPTRTSIPATES